MQRTLKYIRNGREPKPGIFSCFLLALCCFLLISAAPTFAKTLTVDAQGWADFRSIQTAVDQAETGDTIFVYAGEYNENVLVGKSLTLIAENRAVPSENPGIRASDSLEVSQITPEINKITPEINKITPEINKITPEVYRITEEFDLDPRYETLICISPSIKNASSASLLLILDAAGQIDMLEEIENGPFSESEKLVLGESVREIRKKCPIAFLRRDRVVYSYLIFPDRRSEEKGAGSFAEEAGNFAEEAESFTEKAGFGNLSEILFENQSENQSETRFENLSENIPAYGLFAPSSGPVSLTEDENRTLGRIQEASSTYWKCFHRTRVVDFEDYFGPEEVDSGVTEYGKPIPDVDTSKFIIFENRLENGLPDNVLLIPAGLNTPALEILADNVTVRGFAVKPKDGKGAEAGIFLEGVKNCTLLNNRILGMKLGIFLGNCTDCGLEGNILNSNLDALVLENSNRNFLRANSMERGNRGISLKVSNDNRLFENRAEDFSSGFRIEESQGNTIESNTVNCNSWAGFYLLKAEDNRLGNNSINNNHQYGVNLETSVGNTLVQNEVWATINGIALEDASSENTVHDNQLFECKKGLIVSKDSTKNLIHNNTIRLWKIREKSWIEEVLDRIFI